MSGTPSHKLFEKLRQQVLDLWPMERWIRQPIAWAVSGGPDSVALVRLMLDIATGCEYRSKWCILHCDHAIRPGSSQDAEFVHRFAEKCGLPYLGTHRNLDSESSLGGDSEETLRNFRYRQLLKLAEEWGARYLVTGHTADDQLETILFRLFRGTGLSGLQGIPISRVHGDISIVRPLLKCLRADLIRWLESIHQDFRIDETNESFRYTRNFLRHEIIPQIEHRFGPQFRDSVGRVAYQAADMEAFLTTMCEPHLNRLQRSPTGGALDIDPLRLEHLTLIRHTLKLAWRELGFPLKDMSHEKWSQLAELVLYPTPVAVYFPGNICAQIIGSTLTLSANRTN